MATVHAIYENGVFKPKEPVALPEACEVEFEPRLVAPPPPADSARVGREMLAYRDRVKRSLGGPSFRELAHEGHRY